MQSDDELMELTKGGDRYAFEELVLRYRLCTIRFAQRYIKDEFLAEDIAQESFATVYVNRHKYTSKYSFKTYLFTIARNKCIDQLRKKTLTSLEEIEEQKTVSTEDIVLDREDRAMLIELFGKLNKEYKTALYLYEYEELSYKEIGQVMGKSLAQVKIIIYRARKKLMSISEGVE